MQPYARDMPERITVQDPKERESTQTRTRALQVWQAHAPVEPYLTPLVVGTGLIPAQVPYGIKGERIRSVV